MVQGKPLRTINAGEETPATLGEVTNKLKMYSNVTYVDSVCSTFIDKGFTTESTNRMQEHWDVKLRVRLQLLLTLKVMSMTREAKNSI